MDGGVLRPLGWEPWEYSEDEHFHSKLLVPKPSYPWSVVWALRVPNILHKLKYSLHIVNKKPRFPLESKSETNRNICLNNKLFGRHVQRAGIGCWSAMDIWDPGWGVLTEQSPLSIWGCCTHLPQAHQGHVPSRSQKLAHPGWEDSCLPDFQRNS